MIPYLYSDGEETVDVNQILYSVPDIKISAQVDGDEWIDIHYGASIHRDHPIIDCSKNEPGDLKENKFWSSITECYPGPELQAWLDQRPYDISYKGNRILINLTEKDMALFKVFWG